MSSIERLILTKCKGRKMLIHFKMTPAKSVRSWTSHEVGHPIFLTQSPIFNQLIDHDSCQLKQSKNVWQIIYQTDSFSLVADLFFLVTDF